MEPWELMVIAVGTRYKSKAEFAGGLILIVMGLLILLDHTGIIYCMQLFL